MGNLVVKNYLTEVSTPEVHGIYHPPDQASVIVDDLVLRMKKEIIINIILKIIINIIFKIFNIIFKIIIIIEEEITELYEDACQGFDDEAGSGVGGAQHSRAVGQDDVERSGGDQDQSCVEAEMGVFSIANQTSYSTPAANSTLSDTGRLKRKRGDLRLHLKRNDGLWQGERETGSWQALRDQEMDPLKGLPEFDESFRMLIRPATRKSRRERKNIPDDELTPPPSSSSDEDFFEVKKKKRKVGRK